ncbi:MAG TPA: UvrD-helicase domain-containing protein [Clostridia bacterium]|nr:UvrD-helicase domain-containing protein [Clostridia bacterium]
MTSDLRAILGNLNPAQREAVVYPGGPLLVLAGAGSGKTRTLTHRIAYLIKGQGIHPSRILAITFTNKAAGEMKKRVEALLGEDARGLWVSTFHAACVRILRADINHLGSKLSPHFTIYDREDQMTLVKSCLKDLRLDSSSASPGAVLAAISRAKNEVLSPEEFASRPLDFFGEKVSRVYALYQKRLEEDDALDFDDLLMLTVKLFEKAPGILAKYQERFLHVLIDEYQDTNHCQYVLSRMLAEKHRNISVVGDDDQSIYGWRGADIRNILEFERDYPDARVVRLEQNYRSTKTILSAANEVIKNNGGRKGKTLWTTNEKGSPIKVSVFEDDMSEAAWVADEVSELIHRGVAPSDIAVFYRIHAQSRSFEEAFIRRGIRYQIFGGVKFYERREIKDLLAYLRVLQNPFDRQSLGRIINVPRRGVGKATWDRLLEWAAKEDESPVGAIMRWEAVGIKGASAKGLSNLAESIKKWRIVMEEATLDELMRRILVDTGYLKELQLEATPEAVARIENLEELMSQAARFRPEAEEVFSDRAETPDFVSARVALPYFLAHVSLLTDADVPGGEQGGVLMMTLHSAKGLEFPYVFMVGMEEGLFPHIRSMESSAEIEEERRLCYVGMTRAKKELFLTRALLRNTYGELIPREPSRFLAEIPEEFVEEMDETTARSGRASSGYWVFGGYFGKR